MITIFRKTKLASQDPDVFEKTLDTLDVLMCKVGLKDSYDSLVSQYEKDKLEDFKETLLRALFRCKLMYQCLSKL